MQFPRVGQHENPANTKCHWWKKRRGLKKIIMSLFFGQPYLPLFLKDKKSNLSIC